MLFDKTQIGGIDATCRIIRSATFEGMADINGYPTERLFQNYETLADGGSGIIITGMMAVSPMEPYQHCQIRISSDDCIRPLQKLTAHVHDHGGKIIAQLVIMGSAIALPEGDGMLISPSGIPEKVVITESPLHVLQPDEIEQLVRQMTAAVVRAKKAGYDGIQIHGAHGYLASKFLTPYFNKRTDKYGGSLENRARFLLECIRAAREAVGPYFPMWLKLNSTDYMEEGSMTFEESKKVMTWAVKAGINAIEISGGNTASLPRQGPIRAIRRTKEPMYFASYAADAAACLKSKVDIGVVGGFRNVTDMEQCLQTTNISFISLSRPLLREPDLPNRWRKGDKAPALCISCSRCFKAENVNCIFNEKKD